MWGALEWRSHPVCWKSNKETCPWTTYVNIYLYMKKWFTIIVTMTSTKPAIPSSLRLAVPGLPTVEDDND